MKPRTTFLTWVLVVLGANTAAAGALAESPQHDSPREDLHTRLTKTADQALDWLAKSQHQEGYWRGDSVAQREGKADSAPEELSIAYTGLAILAFTGSGHTHRDGRRGNWRPVIERAAKWLISQQDSDTGRYGLSDSTAAMLEHAIATMATVELLAMSRDRELLSKSCEKAARFLMECISTTGGWRGPGDKHDDPLITPFATLAIKTCKLCASQRLFPIPRSEFGPILIATRNGFRQIMSNKKSSDRDLASAVLLLLFSGVPRDEIAPDAVTRILDTRLKEPHKGLVEGFSPLSAYFASYALFQFSVGKFRAWAKPTTEALQRAQITAGANKGSWDPTGKDELAQSRVGATALNLLTLGVGRRWALTRGRDSW